MLKIADLINRYSNLTVPDSTVRKKVSEIIKECFDFEIPIEKITLRRNIVFINCSPALKCEIQLRKTEILNKLKDEMGNKAPGDIS